MRVVLDTNVFVSALLSTQGNPKRIITAWEQGYFDLLVSRPRLDEIGRVLRYPRIAKRHQQGEAALQRLLQLLQNKAIMIEATEVLHVVQEDESDNRYLECAVAGRARFLISGDNHLLELGDYRGIVILPPAAFMALLDSGQVV